MALIRIILIIVIIFCIYKIIKILINLIAEQFIIYSCLQKSYNNRPFTDLLYLTANIMLIYKKAISLKDIQVKILNPDTLEDLVYLDEDYKEDINFLKNNDNIEIQNICKGNKRKYIVIHLIMKRINKTRTVTIKDQPNTSYFSYFILLPVNSIINKLYYNIILKRI